MNCDFASCFYFSLFFKFYFAGVGARKIMTIGRQYNSAEQGTTITSGFHDLRKLDPSLGSLESNQQGETRSENRLKRSRDSSLCNRSDEFFTADSCSC